MLKAAWNRVRLNGIGTVEMRGIDSNYPEIILALATLVYTAADRVTREHLTVRPAQGARVFELTRTGLVTPDFKYLDGDLLYAAVTEGVKSPDVKAYLDSILAFIIPKGGESSESFAKLRIFLNEYHTTEEEISQAVTPTATAEIAIKEGLRLVLQSCDKLEEQVSSLLSEPRL